MLSVDTQVLVDAEAVAQQACAEIAAAAQAAIRERGVFRLVMAGGGTPQRAYTLLAATVQDWDKWEIFWGDERCLPVDHLERNSQMSLPTPHRFPIPAELGAEAAAAAYAQTIHDKLPFDMVMLGMGEDGHTASLFPGFAVAAGLTTAVHNAPKPPPDRVSLTVEALQHCRQQLVLVTGQGKAEAMAQWRNGEHLPIAAAVRADACVLVDAAANSWHSPDKRAK
jgi:6-phosphogluconolactonase